MQVSPEDVISYAAWNASSFSNVQVVQHANPYFSPAGPHQTHDSISAIGIALIVVGALLVAGAIGTGSWYD